MFPVRCNGDILNYEAKKMNAKLRDKREKEERAWMNNSNGRAPV
jgi:hypothetical protein